MMTANGLAKLIEECGELQQIAGKILAYGLGSHPDGTESLKTRLQEELADVMGAGGFVIETLALDAEAINQRSERKAETFRRWHEDPNEPDGPARVGGGE